MDGVEKHNTEVKYRVVTVRLQVEHRLRTQGDSFVWVQFNNQQQLNISCNNQSAKDVEAQINQVAFEMDVRETLSKAGFKDKQLQSDWGFTHVTGRAEKIPIA